MKNEQAGNEDQVFADIAKQHLRIETLEERGFDRLDFHTVSVWDVRKALQVAYRAGLAAAQTGQPRGA